MTTAQEFAQFWHRALFDREMGLTWQFMTEDFRRVIAQVALREAWARGEEVDALVEVLARAAPERGDLEAFYAAACSILQGNCGVAPELVGAGTAVRIEAPAYEVVRLYLLEDLAVDSAGDRYLPNGASARALALIASAGEPGSWRMAGIGAVMTPGWPPTVAWAPPQEI